MKKIFALGAAFALLTVSCDMQVTTELPSAGNIPFELSAPISPVTRTAIDSSWNVAWENGDLIYAVTTDKLWGQAYNDDNEGASIAEFSYADGSFTTSATIADGTHTFNFIYCPAAQKSYHRGTGTTASLSSSQTFDANNPLSALKLNDILIGQAAEIETPAGYLEAQMFHAFAMMKVNVANRTGADLSLASLRMGMTTEIAGVYNVTFGKVSTATYSKSGSRYIDVTVTNGSIANGETLPVYFIIGGLTEYSGYVSFTATDSEGNTYTVAGSATEATFEAGTMNSASISLTSKDGVLDGTPATLTSSEISTSLPSTYGEGSYSNKFGTWGYYAMLNTSKSNSIQVNDGKYVLTPVLGTYIKTIDIELAEASSRTVKILDASGISTLASNTLSSENACSFDISTKFANQVRISSSNAIYISKITITYSMEEVEPIKLDTPVISCTAHDAESLSFSWAAVENASKYAVSWNGGAYEDCAALEYAKTGLTSETEYTIKVKAVGNGTTYLDSDEATLKYSTDKAGTVNYSTLNTSNVTLTATGGTNAYDDIKVKVNGNSESALKVGTSKKGGSIVITVPSGTKALHVHAAAWTGVTGLKLNITPADKTDKTSIDLIPDTGITGSSPFTLAGTPTSYYFCIPLKNITAETAITFTTATEKRFVMWGVNAEPAE